MVLICTILSAGVFSIECLGLWVSGPVFSLNVWGESGCGFWATLVSNNRERTEDMTRDVAEGYEGVFSSLGYDIATCLRGAV